MHEGDLKDLMRELKVNVDDLTMATTFDELVSISWTDKRIFAGVYLRRIGALIDKMIADKPIFCVLVVPELRCEQWYAKISDSVNFPAVWVMLADDGESLVDRSKRGVGRFPFPIWVVKISYVDLVGLTTRALGGLCGSTL